MARRRQRVLDMLHTLPAEAQKAINDLLEQEQRDEAEAHGAAVGSAGQG